MRIHADVGKCQGYGNCAGLDKEHFDLEWPSRQYFHMMVNSTVGEESAAEVIIQGMTSVKGSGICP